MSVTLFVKFKVIELLTQLKKRHFTFEKKIYADLFVALSLALSLVGIVLVSMCVPPLRSLLHLTTLYN